MLHTYDALTKHRSFKN